MLRWLWVRTLRRVRDSRNSLDTLIQQMLGKRAEGSGVLQRRRCQPLHASIHDSGIELSTPIARRPLAEQEIPNEITADTSGLPPYLSASKSHVGTAMRSKWVLSRVWKRRGDAESSVDRLSSSPCSWVYVPNAGTNFPPLAIAIFNNLQSLARAICG